MNMPPKRYNRQDASPAGRQEAHAAAMRDILDRFDRSQWWSEQDMLNQQFRLLRGLLVHAFTTVPFYRQSFEAAGLSPDMITPGNWRTVPILTRDALQTQNILSSRIPPAHGKTSITQTSGSTGQPVRITTTGYTNFFWQAITVRDHLWHRRNLAGKLAAIRYISSGEIPSAGVSLQNWGPATAALFETGPSMLLSISTNIDHQLEWLRTNDPDYLLTYPSNLAELIKRSQELNITFASLKEVRTVGETVTPELRTSCQEVWNASITDIYSSQELGYIALQCPEHECYHIQSENVLVEIIDEHGRPCQPGEIGRLVATSLHNYATPLIRYEIRDYAEAGAACPCGRGLPVINRIAGRRRNMLTLPSGEKCWPITGFPRYKEVAPIRQFQFIQHSLEHIEMKLVADEMLTAGAEERLTAIIREGLGHPFVISFTPMPVIPQGPGGKFEEFVSLIP